MISIIVYLLIYMYLLINSFSTITIYSVILITSVIIAKILIKIDIRFNIIPSQVSRARVRFNISSFSISQWNYFIRGKYASSISSARWKWWARKTKFFCRKEIDRALLAQTIALENRPGFHYRGSWRRERARARACTSSAFKSNPKSGGQCKLLFTAWGCGRRRIGRSRSGADSFEWCANSLPFFHASLFFSRPPRGLRVNDCGSQGDNPGSSARFFKR